jgi:glucose-1-phosphate cytidylyltransferase
LKVVILCGGFGTRLSEETQIKPKPMVEIGGRPILWHIMKIYERYGYKDFLLALGYKGEIVMDYFLNYHAYQSNLTIRLKTGDIEYTAPKSEDWVVSLIDTGATSMTGGRLRRLKSMLQDQGTFMLTYGDGVSNIDISSLLAFHRAHGKIATVTSVRPPSRFGHLTIDGDKVGRFSEKPLANEGWINGGFFVFERGIFDYLDSDATVLEKIPLERLASEGQLMAYRHTGYWQAMDTLRDKHVLEEQWATGSPPWGAR